MSWTWRQRSERIQIVMKMPTICLLTIRKNWFCLCGDENVAWVAETEGAKDRDSLVSSSVVVSMEHSSDDKSSSICASNVAFSKPLIFCWKVKYFIWVLAFGEQCSGGRRGDSSSSPTITVFKKLLLVPETSGTWGINSSQCGSL